MDEIEYTIDDLLDADWNEAVDSFQAVESDDPEQNDENFQTALRDMVRGLQRRAYERGLIEGEDGAVHVHASLDVEQSRALIRAVLDEKPLTVNIKTFTTPGW